jgi:hypothetical protein
VIGSWLSDEREGRVLDWLGASPDIAGDRRRDPSLPAPQSRPDQQPQTRVRPFHRFWVSDITQQRAGEGWWYLVVVLDASSGGSSGGRWLSARAPSSCLAWGVFRS